MSIAHSCVWLMRVTGNTPFGLRATMACLSPKPRMPCASGLKAMWQGSVGRRQQSQGRKMPIRPEMKARYPADWKLRSRFVRKVRAGNRCEWCGVQNGAWRNTATGEVTTNPLQAERWFIVDGDKVSRIVLTCAHVYDHRPEAASLLNLAALCQRCHNRHDAAMRRAGRLSRRQKECLPSLCGEA